MVFDAPKRLANRTVRSACDNPPTLDHRAAFRDDRSFFTRACAMQPIHLDIPPEVATLHSHSANRLTCVPMVLTPSWCKIPAQILVPDRAGPRTITQTFFMFCRLYLRKRGQAEKVTQFGTLYLSNPGPCNTRIANHTSCNSRRRMNRSRFLQKPHSPGRRNRLHSSHSNRNKYAVGFRTPRRRWTG